MEKSEIAQLNFKKGELSFFISSKHLEANPAASDNKARVILQSVSCLDIGVEVPQHVINWNPNGNNAVSTLTTNQFIVEPNKLVLFVFGFFSIINPPE